MSNPHEQPSAPVPPIRRVTAQDRKTRIEAGSLFPPEETRETQEAPALSPQGGGTQPPRSARKKRRRTAWRANLISLFFLLASVGMIVYFAYVWQYPFSPLNPLAPPTPLPVFVTATPPAGGGVNVPTVPLAPTASPTREPRLLAGEVSYAAYDGDAGCDWSGIEGRVLTISASLVRIEGEGGLSIDTITGARGEYSVQLADAPRVAVYRVSLYDASGTALTAPVEVITRDTCDENAAQLSFTLE